MDKKTNYWKIEIVTVVRDLFETKMHFTIVKEYLEQQQKLKRKEI